MDSLAGQQWRVGSPPHCVGSALPAGIRHPCLGDGCLCEVGSILETSVGSATMELRLEFLGALCDWGNHQGIWDTEVAPELWNVQPTQAAGQRDQSW